MVINNELNHMLTVREVSALLHVHPNTLRRWSDAGRIQSVRISSRGDRRFRLTDIASFLAEFEKSVNNNGIAIRL